MPRLPRLVPLLPLLLAGCVESSKPTPLSRSLYARLGGEEGIKRIVDDFVADVAENKDIRPQHKKHFVSGDVAGLKRKLVEQLCEATGGPQKYTGKTMREAHKGLGINDKDFNALVASLKRALKKNNVGEAEQKELLDILAPLKGEVVEPARPDAGEP